MNFPLKIFLLGKLRKEEEEEKIRLLRVDTITNEEECDTEKGFIVNDDIGISSENMPIFPSAKTLVYPLKMMGDIRKIV